MTGFDAFIKKSEIIDISFFLYADPKIDIFVHAEDEETVKSFIDQRNEFLRNMANEMKEERETPSGEEKSNEDLIPKIDIEKIAEEKAKGNDSLEIKDGIVQMIFKEENLFEVKIKVKQPNASEVNDMISAATVVTKDGMKIDFNRYNEIRVHQLLKSWNFKKENQDGNTIVVPVNEKNIASLHPKVFNALVFYINLKIDVYLDNLIY